MDDLKFGSDRTKVIYRGKSYSIRSDRRGRYIVPAASGGIKQYIESQLEALETKEGKKKKVVIIETRNEAKVMARKAKEILNEIFLYRKEKKGKCVSTTHYLTVTDYNRVAGLLIDKYTYFEVKRLTIPKVGFGGKKVELTIPM